MGSSAHASDYRVRERGAGGSTARGAPPGNGAAAAGGHLLWSAALSFFLRAEADDGRCGATGLIPSNTQGRWSELVEGARKANKCRVVFVLNSGSQFFCHPNVGIGGNKFQFRIPCFNVNIQTQRKVHGLSGCYSTSSAKIRSTPGTTGPVVLAFCPPLAEAAALARRVDSPLILLRCRKSNIVLNTPFGFAI